MHPRCCLPATSWVYCTTSCNTQSGAPEDGQNNSPKHFELTGIINKPLLLHLLGCLYYLYQWCTVKQISDNEIYLLIKYVKSVLCRVVKHLSYVENAQCLKVNTVWSWTITASRTTLNLIVRFHVKDTECSSSCSFRIILKKTWNLLIKKKPRRSGVPMLQWKAVRIVYSECVLVDGTSFGKT